MRFFTKIAIVIKSIIAGIVILIIKNFVFKNLSIYGQDFHDLIELSDITCLLYTSRCV